MWYLLILLISVILFFGGRLYIRQWSLIFRPGNKNIGSPSDLNIAFENLYLKGENEKKIHGWWIPGKIMTKAIIFFHGTIGNITYELRAIGFLHSLGASLLVVDYPGYGKSEGRPDQMGCYIAADVAWDFVSKEKGFTDKDIILYGRSLGSAVATYLAAKWNCGGLVFQSGFTSIPDMAARMYPYLPVRIFCHTKLNALKLISHCKCPVLVLHSKSDEFIPIKHAKRIYLRAPSPKRFVYIPGTHSSNEWQLNKEVRNLWNDLLTNKTMHWDNA